MNRTKKRAHKRALSRVKRTLGTPTGFKFRYPMTQEFKIKNILDYRTYFHTSLGEAKEYIESLLSSRRRPQRPIPPTASWNSTPLVPDPDDILF